MSYAAQTWAHPRDVVLKVEHGERGPNPRFVVTTLTGFDAGLIYDRAFCPRGQSENHIKDFKNALAADRLSCHRFAANTFRLLLHALAYRLMYALRAEAGKVEPSLRRVQLDTLRLRWLKVAALVVCSVRRIVVRLPRVFPFGCRVHSDRTPPRRHVARRSSPLTTRRCVSRIAGCRGVPQAARRPGPRR